MASTSCDYWDDVQDWVDHNLLIGLLGRRHPDEDPTYGFSDLIPQVTAVARIASEFGLYFPIGPKTLEGTTEREACAIIWPSLVRYTKKTKASEVYAELKKVPTRWGLVPIYQQALAIELLRGTLRSLTCAEETTSVITSVGKMLLGFFGGPAAAIAAKVLVNAAKAVQAGLDVTEQILVSDYAEAEAHYDIQANKVRTEIRKEKEKKQRESVEAFKKAAVDRVLNRWLVVGAGVAVGAAVTFFVWRGRTNV